MTQVTEAHSEKKFVPVFLPWLIAAVALVLYLITLNRWVSFGNIQQVARMSGWSWQPELYGPLFWLLTYPIRWLPVQQIPLALNLFSCICAVLTLALLARSVALLPQDRTQAQRRKVGDNASVMDIRTGWLPPILAALVCGLQLTFWEDATAAASQAMTTGSNEMLDLLVFAYVVRCLLEFRHDWRESWLLRGAFVFGAGVTNNWAMIGFFPVLLIALIWIKGLSFFNLRFLTRMFFCVLVALALYLLLPLAQGLDHGATVPFWPALKVNLIGQKNIVTTVFKYGRQMVLLLALTSLVPVLLISIRWSSYFGDTSELGVALATFMFHVVHLLFLGICIWVALDPAFSPRNKGWGIPFLTFYYLGALSVGYCSAYFLSVFSINPQSSRRMPSHLKLINRIVTAAVWALLFLTPAALLYRNWPQIQTTNGPMLKQYASLLANSLPTNNTVVLSDEDRRLWLMQSYTAQAGISKNYMFLHTDGLKWPEYHRYLKRKYGERWTVEVPPKDYVQQVDSLYLIQSLGKLMASNSVYYLHPSFGYYFEHFYAEPHGLVYQLVPYPARSLLIPRLSKKVEAENNAFWQVAEDTALKAVEQSITPPRADSQSWKLGSLLEFAHLAKENNPTATILSGYYSRSLTYWGVELQKANQLTNAAVFFNRAIALNPDNVVAQIDLECNKNLQAGHGGAVQISKSVEDEFGKYRNWDAVIGANGPFDEPNLCFEQGRVFVRNNLHRQAANHINRAIELASENLEMRLWLAQLYVLARLPDETLKIVAQIRKEPGMARPADTNRTQLLFVESSAYLVKGDEAAAQAVVDAALKKAPADENLLNTAAQVFLSFKVYTNALKLIDKQLAISPDDLTILNNKGFVSLLAGQYAEAIPPFTRVLGVDTNNYSARLNRAIAYFRLGNWDSARSDYEILQKAHPTDYRIYFGLGEIARQTSDSKAAIRNYDLYLANAPTNTAESKTVSEYLIKLKSGSP